MSKNALSRMSVRYFRTAIDDYTVEETQSGSRIIRAFPVFRTGTFKNSWGEQNTWEVEHLQQMVFHYGLLRERNVLPNVPVRDDHRSLFGGGSVIGWVEDLYTIDGYEDGYTRLVADLEITEPDAFDKISRGTWRNRSAEVGIYETNDEQVYWPVFMGVAFVDLPAVEGLFSRPNKNGKSNEDEFVAIRDEEGAPVPHTKSQGGTTTPPEQFNNGGEGGGETPPATPPPAPDPAPAPPAPDGGGGGETPPASPSTHGAPGTVHTFRVNGTPTNDFAAVQAHIDSLETVLREHGEQSRRDFVNELASSGRIAATQVESMANHALSLNDEQYKSFSEMWSAAPTAPLFQQHGQGTVTNPDGTPGPSEIDTLRERVLMHRRSGMTDEKIKETESYKRLMSLTDGKG